MINRFIAKHLLLIVLIFIGMALSSIFMLALPLAFKWAIDHYSSSLFQRDLPLFSIFFIGIIALKVFLQNWSKERACYLTEMLINSLSVKVYEHALNLSVLDIRRRQPSEIIGLLTIDIAQLKLFCVSEILQGTLSILTMICAMVILASMNVWLMLIVLLGSLAVSWVLMRAAPRLKEGFRQYKDIYHEGINRAQEGLTAINVVKSYDVKLKEVSCLQSKIQLSSHEFLREQKCYHVTMSALELIVGVVAISVLLLGVGSTSVFHLSLGELTVFYAYMLMMFSPILHLGSFLSGFSQARVALEKIRNFLSVSSDIDDPAVMISTATIRGRLEVKNLKFQYPGGKKVLNNISFGVSPGEMLGIVGQSGSGKSTLVQLLLGLLKPSAGTILIDDWLIKDIKASVRAQSIGVVFQDDYLFSGTINENICYGLNHVNERDVIQAARAAYVSEFIEELRDGYNTNIQERGLNLSGGQRQRIALARALVRKPKILILDEATCALDALTENAVQKSVRLYCPDAAIITIAHRFSSIVEADRIIVLEQGRIAEQGDHNYLLNQGGLYRTLYIEQFKSP